MTVDYGYDIYWTSLSSLLLIFLTWVTHLSPIVIVTELSIHFFRRIFNICIGCSQNLAISQIFLHVFIKNWEPALKCMNEFHKCGGLQRTNVKEYVIIKVT